MSGWKNATRREWVEVECEDTWSPDMALMVPDKGDEYVHLEIEQWDEIGGQMIYVCEFTPAEAMEFSRLLADFSLRVQLRNDTGLFEDPFTYEDEEHNRA